MRAVLPQPFAVRRLGLTEMKTAVKKEEDAVKIGGENAHTKEVDESVWRKKEARQELTGFAG